MQLHVINIFIFLNNDTPVFFLYSVYVILTFILMLLLTLKFKGCHKSYNGKKF